MPDYGSYCPISLTTDVLADRWTPLVLRELILGNTRFNDISRGLPGMSRTLLTQRLRHLERKGVVQTWPSPTGRGNEYHLTPAGKDLEPIIIAMGNWAVEWLYDELDDHDVDAQTLMWWMHRHVAIDQAPPRRFLVEFLHTAPVRKSFWLVFENGEVSVCFTPPGGESDVAVTATTPDLAAVFSGTSSWREATADGRVRIDGPPALVKVVPRLFEGSAFFDATAERSRRAASADA